MKTQKDRVIEKLMQDGSVDNFWAIENYILRLGSIIFVLRNEGYQIKGAYGRELDKPRAQWKNYYYYL